MTLQPMIATANRVLQQIRHDRRTVAILLLVPCLLMGIVAWSFEGTPVIDHFGPLLLGIFPLFVMFLVTSVATLRERQSGTLERLMTTPLRRGDFVLGYASPSRPWPRSRRSSSPGSRCGCAAWTSRASCGW